MKNTTWIARTAVCLALLIAVQFVFWCYYSNIIRKLRCGCNEKGENMLTDEEKELLLQNRLFAELSAERLDGLLQRLSARTACIGKNSVL